MSRRDHAMDAIAASRAPVIFSHSDAFALNPHPRNVPDDVLALLPANGGVVMVTFVPGFLKPRDLGLVARALGAGSAAEIAVPVQQASGRSRAEELGIGQPAPGSACRRRRRPYRACRPDRRPRPCRDRRRPRRDHDTVVGLGSADDYPNLFAELIRRGWSDRNLAKLAGGNILRAMRRAEAVSRSDERRSAVDGEPRAGE
jgi:membrane dipeptidase